MTLWLEAPHTSLRAGFDPFHHRHHIRWNPCGGSSLGADLQNDCAG